MNIQLPEYQCIKRVRAARIAGITFDNDTPGSACDYTLHLDLLDHEEYHPFPVSAHWFGFHQPKLGGYLVRYEDGYISYSPPHAFEGGYERIPDATRRTPEQQAEWEARARIYGGSQWGHDEIASNPPPPRPLVFNAVRLRVKDYLGRVVHEIRPATPADLVVRDLTGMLPSGVYDPNEEPRTFPTDHTGAIDE